jgi:hypothetical protein
MAKLDINETAFKTAYIANFLASYMAINYDNDCSNGHPGRRYNNQPVEDAVHMADCAWDRIVDIIGVEPQVSQS